MCDFRPEIIKAEICPYCGGKTEMIDSSVVYSKSYGNIYACLPCRAWVGVHKHNNEPLGRLANASLREAKKQAHHYFDHLWNMKISKGYKKNHARSKAYIWLSKQLGTQPEHTHIGMFDIDMCMKVVELCKPFKK